MGASGRDVQLSESALRTFHYAIECKSRASFALYKDYEQAKGHGDEEALLIIRANHRPPLAIVSLDHFMELCKKTPS